ncbi:hypothetical protein CRP01_10735 [Flavilitoribacter nigricans DSM 23189 = NBRC 102662]|uniref:ABC transporter permease n=2 Tax=Flavilitoribacter TaxID=2762562 RepID=A0A2D0NFA7_FLAN2|nr:hypothetical protein CRP01_10735 [Flavilitoribacter nigricans DSM 23189 = NBRC 102662]
MFRNYIKIALRGLVKHRAYSFINILGLATGMAVTLLIGLWVYHEASYDRFLPDYEQVYQIKRHYTIEGETHTIEAIALPLVEIMENDIPGIAHVALSDWGNAHSLMVGETKLSSQGYFVGEDFLQILKYPLLRGEPATVLNDPNSIVLTEQTATALFGDADPMGQAVKLDNSQELTVSGILRDVPGNSTMQFSYLLPFSLLENISPYVREARNEWLVNSFMLYLGLAPGVDQEQITPLIENILAEKSPDLKPYDPRLSLQPAADWHLYGRYENGRPAGGYIEYVRLFGIIGLLVLIIACINFMNLATARSEKRAKEVGVRKAIGSKRKHLIVQFLSESLLLTTVSFALGILLVYLVLEPFNQLVGSEIRIPFDQPLFWLLMVAYLLLTALLAGSRPAFYLSSFNAVRVLKGGMQKQRSAVWGRKALVLIQFSCSIALIISTLIIYQQIRHVQDRPTGYLRDRLMMSEMSEDLNRNYEAIKADLLGSGLVEQVAKASGSASEINFFTIISNWPGRNPDRAHLEIGAVRASETYFKTMGMEIIAGRDFKSNLEADSHSVILNEAAIRQLQLDDPIGQTINWNRNQNVTIVGVVKDAILLSPFTPVHPTLFAPSFNHESSILYRLSPNVSPREAIPQLAEIFDRYNPAFPYEYQFADEAYARKFQLELLVGKLAGLFAGLAIFVSCLGLFGLAAFMAEQRRKEIGIRKVLGATLMQIWLLLSREFLLLVLISCVLATPLALYFLQDWLLQYDYRISISPLTFVLAGLLALIITVITISFQAIRAGTARPVDSLRSE